MAQGHGGDRQMIVAVLQPYKSLQGTGMCRGGLSDAANIEGLSSYG